MSLLNEMLNDIEKKSPQATVSVAAAIDSEHQSKPKSFFALYGRPFLLSLIVANIIALSLIWFGQKSNKTKAPVHVKKVLHLPPKAVKNLSSVKVQKPKAKKIQAQKKQSDTVPMVRLILSKLKTEPIPALPVSTKKETTKPIKQFVELNLRQQSEKQVLQAEDLVDAGELKRAEDLLNQVIAKDKHYQQAYEVLASIQLKTQSEEQAIAFITQSLQHFPQSALLITYKARNLIQNTHYHEALRLMNSLSPIMADNTKFYALKAVLYEKLGMFKEAGELYQMLVRVEPANGAYWLGFGLARERQHDYNQALACYYRVLESQSVSPVILSFVKERITGLRG